MEATRTIIDTDVLIDLLRNVKQVVGFLAEIEEKGSLLSTTVINAFELYYVAHQSRNHEQNILATKKLLNRLILLSLEPASTETAGIHAQQETKGQPIGLRGHPHRNNRPHKRIHHHHQKQGTPPKNNWLKSHNCSLTSKKRKIST